VPVLEDLCYGVAPAAVESGAAEWLCGTFRSGVLTGRIRTYGFSLGSLYPMIPEAKHMAFFLWIDDVTDNQRWCLGMKWIPFRDCLQQYDSLLDLGTISCGDIRYSDNAQSNLRDDAALRGRLSGPNHASES
jgi:hypothetical protein